MISSNKVSIVFGGGCHWCTEAVFESLKGVYEVDQGWAASKNQHSDFSEAVMLSFDASEISLEILIEIHLLTHSSTANHSMRGKYRSAIYTKNIEKIPFLEQLLADLGLSFDKPLVTKVLPLIEFKSNKQYQNYYYNDPNRPFCQRYISPKLELILARFSKYVELEKANAALQL